MVVLNNKQKLVLQGYFLLTETEQREIDEAIEDHKNASGEKKASVRKGFLGEGRVTVGPVATGSCPCCNR